MVGRYVEGSAGEDGVVGSNCLLGIFYFLFLALLVVITRKSPKKVLNGSGPSKDRQHHPLESASVDTGSATMTKGKVIIRN